MLPLRKPRREPGQCEFSAGFLAQQVTVPPGVISITACLINNLPGRAGVPQQGIGTGRDVSQPDFGGPRWGDLNAVLEISAFVGS